MILNRISKLTFAVGLGFTGFALYKYLYNYFTLPKGVCPLSTGRPYAIAGLIFIALSMILEAISKRKEMN